MNAHTLLLFSATVLPLVCTPGPDILFVSSQAISGGIRAAMRATAGVLLGYTAHSAMVAVGLAALVVASPMLFGAIRWTGICYLLHLAFRLIRSALAAPATIAPQGGGDGLRKGLLTSLLNPKGVLVFVAILPQFMDERRSAPMQAALLSTTFLFWCAVVYSIVSVAVGKVGASGGINASRRRVIDGGAGGMILLAAGLMAVT